MCDLQLIYRHSITLHMSALMFLYMQASVQALRNSLPQGPGDLRIDPMCVKMCGSAFAPASPIPTAGK